MTRYQHGDHQHGEHQQHAGRRERHHPGGECHSGSGHHSGGHAPDEAGLADLLDLDAEVFGSFPDEATEWVERHAPSVTRRVVDLGAGTGTGSLALARRFESAEVVAIDRSALMLDRLGAAGERDGLADRVRVVRADVDGAWPAVGSVDVVWAAWSLHEFADPDRVLGDVYTALKPGGLLVVFELDAFPRFLPDDVAPHLAGLEARWREAIAGAGWNSHPDWRPYLERAGFELAEQRGFTLEAAPSAPKVGRYAHTLLQRVRTVLDGRLTTDDLDTLDRLLSEDGPDAFLHRGDLTARARRTAWAGRRP